MPQKSPQQNSPHHTSQQIRLNQQQLKLYISLSEQPIPDIVNESEENIFSHFKFYFNEDSLMIGVRIQGGYEVSVMHLGNFQERINGMYRQWKENNSKQLRTNTSQLTKNSSQKQAHTPSDSSSPSPIHQNFIAFVQYWIRNSPDLIVRYTVYNELVSQCITDLLSNAIPKLAYSQTSPKRPFNLKPQFKSNKILSKQEPVQISLTDSTIVKRLQIYFTHFSKLQNISPNSSNPLYRNNGSKTFEEIGKIYSTVNLPQWINFVKVFGFDKIFQENFKKVKVNQQSCPKSKKIENSRSYLPVKNVKWSSSLNYFKNLFEKFCDNAKNLDFQAFTNIVRKLFEELFSQDGQKQKQTKTPGHQINNYQKTGLTHLKLTIQSQFHEKLRSLGVFISENPVKIASPTKNYTTIKPKYLQQTTLPALSPIKIKQSKNNHNEPNNSHLLPSLQKKPQKLYTLQNLMKSKKSAGMNYRFNRGNHKDDNNLITNNSTQNENQSIKITSSSSYNPPKSQQNSHFLKQIYQQIEQQPDQYLSHYYKDYGKISQQKKPTQSTKQSRVKNGSNIMKRLDQRMLKINRKVL